VAPNEPSKIIREEEAMFRTTFAHSLGMIGLATILAAPLAWAQESPPIRVRGTIERVEGPIYVIKAAMAPS
jgi:hypothetical protein